MVDMRIVAWVGRAPWVRAWVPGELDKRTGSRAAAGATPGALPLRRRLPVERSLCSDSCLSLIDLQVLCLDFPVHHFP